MTVVLKKSLSGKPVAPKLVKSRRKVVPDEPEMACIGDLDYEI
ncbi:hypothetical protein [Haematobacter massiliensis]|nr:hypothetical protein [Haematobacter massiliensis]